VAFLLAWIIPFWLVFEAVPTKLPHYVLPAFPAIAILIMLAFERGALLAQTLWARILLRLVSIIPLVLLTAGIGLSFWSGQWPGVFAFLAAPVLVWLALYLLRKISTQNIETMVLSSVALAISAYVFVFSGVMTSGPFQAWRMSPRLAEAARQAMVSHSQCARFSAVTVGFNEPSLVFLTGTDLLMTGGEEAARFIQGAPCRVAFVDMRGEAAFKSALSTSSNIALLTRIEGLNLNGGRKLDMGVYALKVSAP
jgi:4-amino-4-deoxy-L-arabinose transferase-like glycosyltransferase